MGGAASSPLRRLSVGHVALALPLLAVVIGARLPIRDNSYLWHVRAGTVQIDAGEVLTADPFSFTALGRPWRTQSWLMDLLYGFFDRLIGLNLVTPLVILGAGLLVAGIAVRVSRVVGSPLTAAVGTIWVMWLTIGYFTPRPVLFSLALLIVFLLAADDPKLRWTLPLLMWLWASIHGGFIVGLGYLVLDGLRRRDRQRVLDLAAATAATLLTAHGWGAWEVVVKFLATGPELDLIVEWLTPDFLSLGLFPFALALVALLVVAIRGEMTLRDLWVVVPFILFAFTANRAVPISALVLCPWFVSILRTRPRPAPSISARQSVLNLAIVGVVLVLPWLLPVGGGLDEKVFGLEAVARLEPVRTFHDDAIGGYLIYSQWPDRLVYIDDRAELYGADYREFAEARGAAPGWEEVFNSLAIEQALLEVSDPLTEMLQAKGWVETYRGQGYVILVPSPINQ
jgi:hypothetical protein